MDQDLSVYNPAAEHLEPLALVEHLQLEGRLREREVVLAPAQLRLFPEETASKSRQKALQVLGDPLLDGQREDGKTSSASDEARERPSRLTVYHPPQ